MLGTGRGASDIPHELVARLLMLSWNSTGVNSKRQAAKPKLCPTPGRNDLESRTPRMVPDIAIRGKEV